MFLSLCDRFLVDSEKRVGEDSVNHIRYLSLSSMNLREKIVNGVRKRDRFPSCYVFWIYSSKFVIGLSEYSSKQYSTRTT